LGTLQKTQAGEYAFTQSSTSHVMTKEPPTLVTEKSIEKISFATPPKEKTNRNNKLVILGILGFLLLAAIGFTAYYFSTKNSNTNTEQKENGVIAENKDKAADTTSKSINNVAPAKPIVVADSNSFYIVIKEYQDLAIAQKRMKTLTGYGNNLALTTNDSISYKMRMPFKNPMQDTARVRDSLSKFFKAKTYIELP
jgi:hypothetical protein